MVDDLKEKSACDKCGCKLPDKMPFRWCPNCLLVRVSPVLERASGLALALEDLNREFTGRYEFRRYIERGATGAVYHAFDLTSSKDVAIKVLAEEITATKAVRARFEAEAAAMKRLNHGNIVRILDSGVTPIGLPYLVMDLVDGCDLRSLYAERTMQPSEALDLFSQICDAVTHAHSLGVLHLDLKPQNILVDVKGCVRVTDFGIARIVLPPTYPGATQGTLGAGDGWTFGYSAPEQISGKRVDERADIYSLGAVLYEMLTGKLPVGAWKKPSELARCPVKLDAVVETALQPDSRQRQASVTELSSGVAKAGASLMKSGPGRPWMMLLVSVLLLASLAAGIISLRGKDASTNAVQTTKRPEGPVSAVFSKDDREIVDSFSLKYRIENDGSLSVTGYLGMGELVQIPEQVDNRPVKALAEHAFQANSHIRAVEMPEGLETIGGYAFKWCGNLERVVLPQSLKTIGGWAFESCSNLRQPDLPDGIETIGGGAFCHCDKFVEMRLPKNLRKLESYVFWNCVDLNRAVIPRRLPLMEGGALAGCGKIRSIEVENGSEHFEIIDGVLFNQGCTRLCQFPSGRTGAYAVPAVVESLEPRAFSGASGLSWIVLGNSIHNLSEYALAGCPSLRRIDLPPDLETIEAWAFADCEKLPSLEIPAKVRKIGFEAFVGCKALRSLEFLGDAPEFAQEVLESLTDVSFRAHPGAKGFDDPRYRGRVTFDLPPP